ncbi:MAG: cation diffusion facilitator family transporter [Kiritimatiellia bacterium]
MQRSTKATVDRAINVGLGGNIVLAALKMVFGIVGHSNALLADGINSVSDVTYYIVVKICVFFSHKPADHEHPYGHRQLESIAALSVGAFVITTAIALFWTAVDDVYDIMVNNELSRPIPLIALWVALFTVASKILLTLYTKKVSKQTGNMAILALARDHRNDIFTGLSAAVGIILVQFGWAWGDPLLGAVVALVVLATGIQILREAAADLMDAVPSQELEATVRKSLSDVKELKSIEEVQGHRFGPYLILHITVGLDGAITVAEGDRIATHVEQLLYAHMDHVKRVYVHYHPAREAASRHH